jgi:hypothetical protein
MKIGTILIWANVLMVGVTGGIFLHKKIRNAQNSTMPIVQVRPESQKVPEPQVPVQPIVNNISTPVPPYLNYAQTVNQLNKWNEESPELTEVGVYGKSASGKDLVYLRVVNKRNYMGVERPKVLITACIHGNEPLASSNMMAVFGSMLAKYGKDPEITSLLDSRDIYFIPVVSPDSYPNSRYVNGVDPNRDFPSGKDSGKKSVPPVQALRDFFLRINPNAVISGHTHGRICLVPWGDQMIDSPHSTDYKRVIGKMSDMMGYRYTRACDMYQNYVVMNKTSPTSPDYSVPIHGSELDWYYRNNGASHTEGGKKVIHGSMAIVMEMGNHQRIPSRDDIISEFQKTFQGVLYFIKEAPLVEIYWDESGRAVNKDGSPKADRIWSWQ